MTISILDAIDDQNLLGTAIKDAATFTSWRALFAALFGLRMSEPEAEVFRTCTGLTDLPTAAFNILWLIIGRRGGKSFAMALVAVYLSVFRDWRPFLSPGERAVVLLVAADREQAKILRNYVGGLLTNNRLLAQHVLGQTAESIELKGSVVIEIATCSFRAVRGRSVCVALLDETAFWRSEATANPDREVWRAIRASMAQFGSHSVAIIASSPYARKGLLYDGWKTHFAKADATNLVWQAPTKVMNPTISDSFIAAEYVADPVSAASEYGAAFRSDVESFVDLAVVEAVVDEGTFERPPVDGCGLRRLLRPLGWCGRLDDAGDRPHGGPLRSPRRGARAQASLLARGRRDRVRSPSSERMVSNRFWAIVMQGCGRASVSSCTASSTRRRRDPKAISTETCCLSLTVVVSGSSISREQSHRSPLSSDAPARGGRDSIDHGPGGHDDCANVVAGVCAIVIGDGAPDPVPVAQFGTYASRIYGDGGVADRIDRLSPQQALARGLITPRSCITVGNKTMLDQSTSLIRQQLLDRIRPKSSFAEDLRSNVHSAFGILDRFEADRDRINRDTKLLRRGRRAEVAKLVGSDIRPETRLRSREARPVRFC